jgi:hypothetical protein
VRPTVWTARGVDKAAGLSAEDKKKIFEGNVQRAYPRVAARLTPAKK